MRSGLLHFSVWLMGFQEFIRYPVTVYNNDFNLLNKDIVKELTYMNLKNKLKKIKKTQLAQIFFTSLPGCFLEEIFICILKSQAQFFGMAVLLRKHGHAPYSCFWITGCRDAVWAAVRSVHGGPHVFDCGLCEVARIKKPPLVRGLCPKGRMYRLFAVFHDKARFEQGDRARNDQQRPEHVEHQNDRQQHTHECLEHHF